MSDRPKGIGATAGVLLWLVTVLAVAVAVILLAAANLPRWVPLVIALIGPVTLVVSSAQRRRPGRK